MNKRILVVKILLILGVSVLVSCSASDTSNTDNTEMDITNIEGIYVPGVYSSTLQLEPYDVELQITVDKDHINSINIVNMNDSVAVLYPLVEPTLQELSKTIIEEQSIEEISYGNENRYTSMMLMQAITEALDKARVSESTK